MKLSLLYTDHPLNEGWSETIGNIKNLFGKRWRTPLDHKEERAKRALDQAYDKTMAVVYKNDFASHDIENIHRRLKYAKNSKAWIKAIKNDKDPEKAALEKMFIRLNRYAKFIRYDPDSVYTNLGPNFGRHSYDSQPDR